MRLDSLTSAVRRAEDRKRPDRRGAVARRSYPYALVAPTVLLVAVGVIYPVAYMLYLSAHNYLIIRPHAVRFIGLANYLTLLKDGEFWRSLRISAVWVAGSVIPQFLLGLATALLLNGKFTGRRVVRTLVLLPWVVSGVITGIIFVWLFDGTIGVVNDLLLRFHLVTEPVAWPVQPATAFFMLFVANAWRGAPFFAINLLAALQSISPDVYEASAIDGAGPWQRFRHVTLPLIMNTVILSTLLRAIWTFNFIDLIWTMTNGGPVNSTRTLAIYIFHTAYRDADFGYASTLAIGLCIVLLLFSAVYWQLHKLVPDIQ